MLDDIRIGLRAFTRSPGFAGLAVITLALGIAANTAILSVVNGVLLRPLPYGDADRLVTVWTVNATGQEGGHTAGDYVDLVAEQHSFDAIAGHRQDALAITTPSGQALVFDGAHVTAPFFDVFGMPALLGRTFTAASAPTDGRAVVLSEETWREALQGDPQVVGQLIKINGQPYTLLGVMPAAFRWPTTTKLWLLSDRAVPLSPVDRGTTDREVRYFEAVARLRSDVTPAQVAGDLDVISRNLRARRGATASDERRLGVTPLRDAIVGDVRTIILTLQAGVGIVLLIACANISSLLIARTTGRRREMAVRAALGARSARLIRQLLTESLVLGVAGGAVGLLLGSWCVALLLGVLPTNVPRTEEIAIDGTVAVLTLVVALVASALFGALPAIQASRTQAAAVLRAEGGRSVTGARAFSRSALVVAEIALTLVLLVAAGLLTNSLLRLQQVDPGFAAERATVAAVVVPQSRYPTAASQTQFYARLVEALESHREFEASGIGFPGPLRGDNASGSFFIEGREGLAGTERPFAHLGAVSGGYFDAMGVRLLSGRTFTASDTADAPPVVIVSAALARRYWPGEDAIGKHLKFDPGATEPWMTVVGVTSDVRQLGLHEAPPPLMYLPYQQFPLPFTNITVRSRADDGTVGASLRRIVNGLDPGLPFGEMATLEDVVDRSLAEPRFRTAVFGLFATLAVILAAVGVYGLISYTVAQQTREIGIRVALGAVPSQVIGPIVKRGMTLALIGIAIGLAGAWFATRALAQFLFGIGATDLATFTSVAGVLTAVALLASYVPSRRAAAIDPIEALRD